MLTLSPMLFLGAVLLLIKWLGFNLGSAWEVNEIAVNAFVVSILSAASGFLAWVLLEWFIHKNLLFWEA